MNRRDILKAIGIGGILPFVGKTEVKAAPEAPQVVQAPQPEIPYTMESVSFTRGTIDPLAIMGTGSYWDMRDFEKYGYDFGGDE